MLDAFYIEGGKLQQFGLRDIFFIIENPLASLSTHNLLEVEVLVGKECLYYTSGFDSSSQHILL